MWWLDPGKEVLNVIFNRVLAPYVENMDMSQVSYGIAQGELTLRNLRMKKGALDKFRLPVDVLEGHLGKFSMNFHWRDLGNKPVEVVIEDVFLLVVSTAQNHSSPEEDEKRTQEAKAERLENAELLHMRSSSDISTQDSQQNQGLVASITAKILNNLQVTVKNIHVRYEDHQSCPGHPFAAGVTLAGFTAISTDENWKPTFIESTAGSIHKLGNLRSLAVYFDTDAKSIAGLPPAQSIKSFNDMIAKEGHLPDHQFILKPVTGEGRIIMNHALNKDTPRFDVQLLFDEISFVLDNSQYRDAISLVDMYHFYARQHQYRAHRPSELELQENRGKALIKFAGKAILDGIHEKNRKWTWAYFKERRDDRIRYVELFKQKLTNTLVAPEDLSEFQALELKLSYEDIRFYRSIARSRLKKDLAAKKKLEDEKQKGQPQARGWTSWIWGTSTSEDSNTDTGFGGTMTDQQRKELYEALDYDEKTAVVESLGVARDALKARVVAKLNRGSWALKQDSRGKTKELIQLVFDVFRADFVQRPDNFETSISLGDFRVFDGTTPETIYKQIVHVKESESSDLASRNSKLNQFDIEPFFALKFEKNPLDERADSGLSLYMRSMEIIYHKGYVEAIYEFFKPPDSQLQSVEALLNVASETFEGLRKDTRAGLEYALQTHKTVDIKMDMHAPIIIVPESVQHENSRLLVLDAGQILIESNLADKKALREVHLKRHSKYTDDDYQRLESLMYDKFSVKLHAAQFVIGDSLTACRKALDSETDQSLHLVERINIDLSVHNSIVPTARSLARFKASGKLPTLQVNFSDRKYKTLMRLIDVAIPHFGDGIDQKAAPSRPVKPRPRPSFELPSGLFKPGEIEYHLEDHDEDKGSSGEVVADDDQFFEAEEGTPDELIQIHQRVFEFTFQVDSLQASIYKSTEAGVEKPLGDIRLDRFSLAFAVAQFDMRVDIHLRSLSMNLLRPGMEPIAFVSSTEAETMEDADLMTVLYTRVQRESPEFTTIYEGIEQSVDVKLSTFIFQAEPEPVVSLYDFIMTTFVPDRNGAMTVTEDIQLTEQVTSVVQEAEVATADSGTIRVLVTLASVQVILINDAEQLATISLSTADITVMLRANTMHVAARLGQLLITDDSRLKIVDPEFKQILSIEGDDFAELRYQTFDPSDKVTYPGVKSSVHLKAGSLKFHFLEQPLHDVYLFIAKLTRLKGLYDAATQAAAQRAAEIERMSFDISIKTPIIIFPADAATTRDVFTMRLGQILASNWYNKGTQKISASLRGIKLTSTAYPGVDPSILKIIDDVNVTAEATQVVGIDRSKDLDSPDYEVTIDISDVKFHLTQVQYCRLIALSQAIPRVLTGAPEGEAQADRYSPTSAAETPASDNIIVTTAADLQPEITRSSPTRGTQFWTSVDLVLTVNAVKLHLYDSAALQEVDLKDHGISRFALNNNSLRLKVMSDSSLEAEFVIKSFTMSNTRPGPSKFREIVPAAQNERNQLMVLYTASSGSNKSSVAVVTVDSPQVIFAIDPVYALSDFFTSPVKASAHVDHGLGTLDGTDQPSHEEPHELDFRVDLHDVSISVLEDDSDLESQAICLSIKHVFLSQQGILALTVNRVGMSLIRMGKRSESARFLDDVDLTLSLDSRNSASQQMTSIEMSFAPIVFRASYRDIKLITSIVNKAGALFAQSNGSDPQTLSQKPFDSAGSDVALTSKVRNPTSRLRSASRSRPRSLDGAKIVMSKEHLNASFDGFRLVLIGDLHEIPMLHFKMKRFSVSVKDWSSELHAVTTISTFIDYWNLKNSHWEPLIDPWTFSITAMKDGAASGTAVTLLSKERLDVNLCSTFIELAISNAKAWFKEGDRVLQKARGSYAPYRMRNRTGGAIHIWPDLDGSTVFKESSAVRIIHGQTVDWRFEDWKTMREHFASSSRNSIGVQFEGKPWENLRSIPVDKEGEFIFSLRPRTERSSHKVMCEITIEDNVKIVTFRSTYKIENQTLYPLELTVVDDVGRQVYTLEKIAPGQDFACPLKPRQKTGSESNLTELPKAYLETRAPIELENLLPHDVQYKIYDRDSDQNWSSYLRRGGIMPVHSVELGHLVLLNITIQDTGFKPSDFAIINTDGRSDFDIEQQLSLCDRFDRKLDLRLNYVKYPDSGGAFKVQIYSPYIITNKTGLPFSVKSVRSARAGTPKDVAGESSPGELARPTPFMLSHQHPKGNEFIFRVGDSLWSKTVSFEAPSAESAIIIQSTSQKSEIHVGLSWAEGQGKYKLSKVITLAPRFIIKNGLSEPIYFREHGVPLGNRSELAPGERCSLHFMRLGQDKLLTVAYPGLDAHWSPPFNIEDIGVVHVRMHNKTLPDIHLIVANIVIEGATIFVQLSLQHGPWPFVIENDSDADVTLGQTDHIRDRPEAHTMYRLKAQTTISYAWDYPAAREKRIYLWSDSHARKIDIMEIGNLPPLKLQNGYRALALDVRADGPTQRLTITNYREEASLYKPKTRLSASVSRQNTVSSTTQDFEPVQDEVPANLTLTIDAEGLGISLMNKKLLEVVYFTVNQLKVEYTNSAAAKSLNFSCGLLQIDNQLHDAQFPVLLQPSPITREARGVGALPTVQASVIILNDESHGVIFVKYASILLQAITVQIDEAFLYAALDLTKFQGVYWEEETENILIQHPNDIPEPTSVKEGQDVYFEVLEIQPIILSVSFVRNITSTDEDAQKLTTRNPLAVVLNALTMALGNLGDARLELNALGLKDVRLTLPDIQSRIIYHYRQEVLRQLYRLLGSADFLGNPVGLFTNVSSGVADIFYEPWHGVVMHGNKELGIGIAKGAASFVKKTVFGVSDSMTKVTSSLGKGLSAATFDTEYQNRRRMTQRRNRPRHAIYGVTAGAEALANSFASGVEGVVMKPIEGAENEGAFGFFKGVGKGLVGAVTKPVVGVFDLASNVSEGIRNTTTVFDNPQRDRVRKPRLVPATGVLQPYSPREALGQYWLRDMENGEHRKEHYVAHLDVPGGDKVVLLTTSGVLFFWSTKLRIIWDLPFSNLQGVSIEDTGIRFASKAGKEHDRFVLIQEESSRKWFFNAVASVVKSYNAQRRIEK